MLLFLSEYHPNDTEISAKKGSGTLYHRQILPFCETWEYNFSSLPRSPPPYAQWFPDTQVKAIIDALIDNIPDFFPFRNLTGVIVLFRELVGLIHSTERLNRRSILVTGPKGTGKSFLFQALQNFQVLQALRSPSKYSTVGEQFTISFYIDLSDPTSFPSFTAWALAEASTKLRQLPLPEHQAVAQIISKLPGNYTKSAVDQFEPLAVVQRSTLKDLVDEQKRAFADCRRLWGALDDCSALPENCSPLVALSLLLRSVFVGALIFVDEAETLFNCSKYNFETAKTWLDQMHSTIAIEASAIGLVVCASYQRARQFFLSDDLPHQFPQQFRAHLALRNNWNGDKLRHLRMSPPSWTTLELAWFILFRCWIFAQSKSMQPYSNIIRQYQSRRVGEDGSLDTVPHRLDLQASRSLELLQEQAILLDLQFLRSTGDETSHKEILESSLTVFLKLYGRSPRNVAGVLHTLCSTGMPRAWPELDSAGETLRVWSIDGPEALLAFQAYTAAQSEKLPSIDFLHYEAASFAVPEQELLEQIQRSASTTDLTFAKHCVDAALDSGALKILANRSVSLADPAYYIHNLCGGAVSTTITCWLQHPGYGQEAEIILARAFRRLVLSDKFPGLRGLKDISVQVADSTGPIATYNDDTTAPADGLARISVVALSETDSDLQKPLSSIAVTEKMVVSLFGRSEYKRQQAGNDQRAWLAARAAAAKQSGLTSARAIAAYLGYNATHYDLADALSLRGPRDPILVKESPDVLGGDLVGIFPISTGRELVVHILRMQVKVASQKSLRSTSSTASQDRCLETVSKFLGIQARMGLVDSDETRHLKQLMKARRSAGGEQIPRDIDAQILQAERDADRKHNSVVDEAISSRHNAVCQAIADLITMATALDARRTPSSSSQSKSLQEMFDDFAGRFKVKFHDPIMLTTHTVSDATRAMAKSHRVNVLDATDLSTCWGALQHVGRQLGILPFARMSKEEVQKEADDEYFVALFS